MEHVFWGVHISYNNGYHDVIVPKTGCIGTGKNLDEALDDISEKLLYTVELPPSKDACYEFGKIRVPEINEEVSISKWELIEINVNMEDKMCYLPIKDPVVDDIWKSITQGNALCTKAAKKKIK